MIICFSDADPKCPTIPMSIYGDDMNNAAEEVDAPQDKKSMPPGPGSGECGCISGPAYPSIDECDFWQIFFQNKDSMVEHNSKAFDLIDDLIETGMKI